MPENAAERALRLLDIVPYVVQNQGIAVSDLADHFGIKKEELLKDLNLLFLCGLPGYTPLELIDLSVEDDVVVIRDPQNLAQPRNFTFSEVLVLRIALAALQEIVPTSSSVYARLSDLRRKLEHTFSAEIPPQAVNFQLDKSGFTSDLIKLAIREGNNLEISYLNPSKDEITTREITPFKLQVLDDRVLLVSYCHLAQSQRTFNLAQIQQARMVEGVAAKLVANSEFPDSTSVSLQIESSTSEFMKSNSRRLKKILDNKYVIEIHSPQWLIRNVMSEPGIQVELPSELRNQIHEEANGALLRYAQFSAHASGSLQA